MDAPCVSIDRACPFLEPGAPGEAQRQEGSTLDQVLNGRITQRTWGRLRFRVRLGAGRVIIQGSSPTYYLKQLALAAAQEVLPTAPVDLEIRVGKDGMLPRAGHPPAMLVPEEWGSK